MSVVRVVFAPAKIALVSLFTLVFSTSAQRWKSLATLRPLCLVIFFFVLPFPCFFFFFFFIVLLGGGMGFFGRMVGAMAGMAAGAVEGKGVHHLLQVHVPCSRVKVYKYTKATAESRKIERSVGVAF
jgi:hypothetical protein